MRTVVGLFQDNIEARRTVDDLKAIGVNESDVSMCSNEITNGPISAYLDPQAGIRDPESITRALARMGLSETEARRYVEGIQHGYTLETVLVDDSRANDALQIMRAHAIGGGGRGADQPLREGTQPKRGEQETLPVIAEEIAVEKREMKTGGVRATSKVTSTPVERDVSLRTENVDVERRKVDRPATPEDIDALGNRDVEVTAIAEEPIVTKTARVVEEVVVTKDVDTRNETIREDVRRTDVEVQRLPYEAKEYREHHSSTYGEEGGSFDEYEPAYRYGHDMRADEGDDWSSIEPNARADWEKRSPGTWERFKGAIKHAWGKAVR